MPLLPLLLLLLLMGCGEDDAAPAGGGAASADSMGAPLPSARGVEEEWRVRELRHVPRYFLASGWAGADTLWGLAGNTPMFVHVAEPEYRSWRRSYWDASLSSRKLLAGMDQRGIWVGSGDDARLLVDRGGVDLDEGDLSGPLLWSPDGSRLLARLAREGPPLHLVVEARSGAATPLPLRADSLWLGDPFWMEDGRIILTAHPLFDPERGPVGRGDLYIYDPSDRTLRRVARASDGVFLRPLSRWGSEGLLVGESESTSMPASRFRVYDTRSWVACDIQLPAANRVVAHDTTHAVLVLRRDGGREPLYELSLWSTGQGPRPLPAVRGRDLRLFWSPDGRRLAISSAGEELTETGSVRAYYRTWIAER